tara:strand:- start:93 stop:269 length:177 start_codon:yes stop_codon:yes gene_type:complete
VCCDDDARCHTPRDRHDGIDAHFDHGIETTTTTTTTTTTFRNRDEYCVFFFFFFFFEE